IILKEVVTDSVSAISAPFMWLKFEEDVEDGGERWSKPYVATLSLHSLFELRRCITNGTVLLDMRPIALRRLQVNASLKEDLYNKVREAMLKKHHHQNERKLSNRIPLVRSIADIGKKHSDPFLLERNGELLHCTHISFFYILLNSSLLGEKIPPGAEASNVLVGEVDFLEKPIIAFVRLSPAVLITGLTEVPVPTSKYSPNCFPQPTSKNRGWLMDPLGDNPWWTLLVSALPALLCTILIFMDQQITPILCVSSKPRLFCSLFVPQKGCGYHLDLLVVSVILKVESGCSATRRATQVSGNPESNGSLGFMIFVLMGCSVFMTLFQCPSCMEFFLYMGVSSLKGIQVKSHFSFPLCKCPHQPDLIYLRYVPLWKVHVFTLVQLTCLVLLWVIKASAKNPAVCLCCACPGSGAGLIRKLLDLFFTKRELSWLDDLMPESKKKKEDDKKKKARESW
uniref:Solute carrier family 4 member 7 n=1 Tax=Gouania willdenowi TaxID=441366 RepID=A0A8C5GA25_GOUWI